MKKLVIILATMALIAGFGVMKAEAALTDTIAVTVTIQNVSVSITAGDPWTIGTVALGSTSTQGCTANNDGNVSENLTIAVSGSDAWTAGLAAGANVFAMNQGPVGGPYTNITGVGDPLTSGLGAGASYGFELEFKAPTSTSSYAAQSITVTVTAAAA